MFDEDDKFEEEVAKALDVYSLEEILEHNDHDAQSILVLLLQEGFIVLPEVVSL